MFRKKPDVDFQLIDRRSALNMLLFVYDDIFNALFSNSTLFSYHT